MASADQNGHQYVNADQQLIFIFTWNLVKSNDHFQATRLLQLFREENVIDESQERDVKDQGTPAGRSIEFLGAVYNNCRTKRGTFDKFCEVVGKKQLSVLLDHMPGVRRKGSSAHKWEFVGVDDTKEIYLHLKDKGDPFHPGSSPGVFSPANSYVQSMEHSDSVKQSRDMKKVTSLPSRPVPKPPCGFHVVWFTETEEQLQAVLRMLKRHSDAPGPYKLEKDAKWRFNHYAISLHGGDVCLFLVHCPDRCRRSDVYAHALNYGAFNIKLAVLSGRCLALSPDVQRGHVCVAKIAIDHPGNKGKDKDFHGLNINKKLCNLGDKMKLEMSSVSQPDEASLKMLLGKPDATEVPRLAMTEAPRPAVSCYAQMIWLTVLHLEVEESKKNRKATEWLAKTGYEFHRDIKKRAKANEAVLKKFLPDWPKEGTFPGLLSYCKKSGFWPTLEPSEAVKKEAETQRDTTMTEPKLEDDIGSPIIHVGSLVSNLTSEELATLDKTAAEKYDDVLGVDCSTYEFYSACVAAGASLFVSVKAVDGVVGCYSDQCPEPKLRNYCDELVGVAVLDIIEKCRRF